MDSHRLSWAFPSNLGRIADLFHPAVPSIEEIINNHTLFPLLRPFIPEEAVTRLLNHYHGKGVQGIASSVGFAHFGKPGRWNLSICLRCVADDTSCYEFSYWRVGHLVPGLALCPYHLEPLYKYCGSCQSGFRHSKSVWLPSSLCLCGGELQRVRKFEGKTEQAAEEFISQTAHQILAGAIPSELNHARILKTISAQAQYAGFSGRGALAKMRDILINKTSTETVVAYNVSTASNTAFDKTLSGRALIRNPIQNVILIRALFGSLADFINAAEGRYSSVDIPIGPTNDKQSQENKRRRAPRYSYWEKLSEQELFELRQVYRAVVANLKKNIPTLQRNGLRALGAWKAYAFLLRFDTAWFDEILPRKPFPLNPRERWEKAKKSIDISLRKHIYRRRKELLDSVFEGRITHSRLLYGHSMVSRSKKAFDTYPLAKNALKQCIESSEQWLVRQIRMLAAVSRDVSSTSPYSPKMHLTKFTLKELKLLKRRIRKWLEKNGAD